MDTRVEYIKQFIEDPYYSETIWIPSVAGVIDANFKNQGVKYILCNNLWLSYNDNAATNYVDMFGQILFTSPAISVTPSQNTGMWSFNHLYLGSRIFLQSSAFVNTNFSICFQKVWDFKPENC